MIKFLEKLKSYVSGAPPEVDIRIKSLSDRVSSLEKLVKNLQDTLIHNMESNADSHIRLVELQRTVKYQREALDAHSKRIAAVEKPTKKPTIKKKAR